MQAQDPEPERDQVRVLDQVQVPEPEQELVRAQGREQGREREPEPEQIPAQVRVQAQELPAAINRLHHFRILRRIFQNL